MNPAEALAALRAAGLSLEWDGEHIQVSPTEAITPQHREMVKALRPGIIAALKAEVRRRKVEEAVRQLDAFFPIPDPSGEMPPPVMVQEWPSGLVLVMVKGRGVVEIEGPALPFNGAAG